MRFLLLLLLGSCQGHQLEPYVEYRYRDESFTNSVEGTEYGGDQVVIGFRYVPPLRLWGTQFDKLTTAIRGRELPAAPPIVIDHKDDAKHPAKEGGEADRVVSELGKWGIEQWAGISFMLIALTLLAWLAPRAILAWRSKPADDSDAKVE